MKCKENNQIANMNFKISVNEKKVFKLKTMKMQSGIKSNLKFKIT